MSKIDFSKIKVGDFVTARLPVVQVDAPDKIAPLKVDMRGVEVWLVPSDITSHEPAPWVPEVGDLVGKKGQVSVTAWEVVAIRHGQAVLYCGIADTHPVSDLTLIRKGSAA